MRTSETESVVMELPSLRGPLDAEEGAELATHPPTADSRCCFHAFTPPLLFCPESIAHASFARRRLPRAASTSERGALAVRRVKQAAF